jgi:uncharacterized protein (TIGR00106 family)
MSVIVEFSIFPLDQGESLSPYVARAVKIVEQSGLAYHFGPMATSVEGETLGEVLAVVEKCFEDLKRDCGRISISMRVDYREKGGVRLEEKVESVKKFL